MFNFLFGVVGIDENWYLQRSGVEWHLWDASVLRVGEIA